MAYLEERRLVHRDLAARNVLLDKLNRSAQAFASQDDSSGEEIYLFVLEDLQRTDASGRPRVVGTSGIAASAGFADRFYSYRNEMVVHASAALGESNRIHTLHPRQHSSMHRLRTCWQKCRQACLACRRS